MLRLALIIAAAALVMFVSATVLLTDRRPQPPPNGDRERDFPITLTDDEAVASTLAAEPQTIISNAAQFTEVMFALGIGSRIVGVSAGETYPPEATALPRVVLGDGITPDTIRVGELAPDLVITSGMPQAEWKTQLRNAGMVVVTLNATSFDDALSDIGKVGRLTGKRRRTADLVARLRSAARALSPPKEKPTVFVETFYSPLTGAGSAGFIADMVRLAGGQLIARTTTETEAWSIVDLKRADPAVYVAFSSTAASKEEISNRPGFGSLPAVKSGRIIVLNDDTFLRPGPRMVQGLETLAKALSASG